MIRLNQVTLYYGMEKALEDVTVMIDETEAYTIIGRSGCGKSSLTSILMGIKTPTSGKISYQGSYSEEEFYRKASLCLQGQNLFPWKTVYENIIFSLKARGIKSDRALRAEEALAAVRLSAHKHKYPSHLSGGQRQRAALACALAFRSSWMVLDEPSTGLDFYAKEDMKQLILEIYKKYKIGYLLVTHDIEEAVHLGRQIIVMEKANVKEVINNPYYRKQNPSRDYYEFIKNLKGCLF